MSNLSSSTLSDLESKTSLIVKESGTYIMAQWNSIKEKKLKDKRDLVTNVDIEVENKIRTALHSLLPEAGFIVEEGKTEKSPQLNWAIDPIDGTKNYASFYPQFFVQVSLLQGEEAVLGVIYNPVSDQLFSASKGNGAKLNNTAIEPRVTHELESAIIDVDFGGNDQAVDWKIKLLNKLIKSSYRVRMSGGFGNVYLLTGAFDAVVYLDKQEKFKYIVDNAPRIILAKEAGFEAKMLEFPEGEKVFIYTHSRLMKQIENLILLPQ